MIVERLSGRDDLIQVKSIPKKDWNENQQLQKQKRDEEINAQQQRKTEIDAKGEMFNEEFHHPLMDG